MTNLFLSTVSTMRPTEVLYLAISVIIVVRIFFFSRGPEQHVPWGGWVSVCLMSLYATYPIYVLFGIVIPVHWSFVGISAILMVAVMRLRGNVVPLFRH